eukprot:XP_001691728.1 predicted protein [Chlamydomonas reinhardtii]
MDASHAAPSGRSVFSSDDDLTSFLAGLRAKYATLYPQYLEGEQPAGAGGAAAVDTALAGTSLSFDHKLTQLRSSLQSLQQLLPPRASTTANLLESFVAVSGDEPPPQPAEPAPAHSLYLQQASLADPQSSSSSPQASSEPDYRADANETWHDAYHLGHSSYDGHGAVLGHTDSELELEGPADPELYGLHQEPRRTSGDAEDSAAEEHGAPASASTGDAVELQRAEAAAGMGSITRSMVSPARRRVWQLVGQGGSALGGSNGRMPEPAQPLDMPDAEHSQWPPRPASVRPAGSPGPHGLRLLHSANLQNCSHGGGSSGASTGGGGTGPDATRESSAVWESEATGAEDKEAGEDHGSTSCEEPGLASQTEWCGFGGFGKQSPSLLRQNTLTPVFGFGPLPTGDESPAPGGFGQPDLQSEARLQPASTGISPHLMEGGAEWQHQHQQLLPSSEQRGSLAPSNAVGASAAGEAVRQRRRWGSPLQGSAVSGSWQHIHAASVAAGVVGGATSSLHRSSPNGAGANAGMFSPTVATARASQGGSPSRHVFSTAAPAAMLAMAGADGEVLLEPDAPAGAHPAAGGFAATYQPYGEEPANEPSLVSAAAEYEGLLQEQGFMPEYDGQQHELQDGHALLAAATEPEPEHHSAGWAADGDVSNGGGSSAYSSSGGVSGDGRPIDPRLQHRHAWQDTGVSTTSAARGPRSLRLVPPTPHTGVAVGQPYALAAVPGELLPNHNDEVLCGSPTSDMAATAGAAQVSEPGARGSGSNNSSSGPVPSYTANRGGVAFIVGAEGAGGRSPLRSATPRASPMRAARAAPHATSQPTQPSVNTADAPAGPLDWDLLNRQLREAGFGGLAMVSAAATAAAIANAAAEAASAPGGGVLMAPEPGSLHRCLGSVLEQYVRRNKLVTELLAATEQSGRVAAQQEAALRDLQRELNVAKAAADRARRELAELASQQLPKTEARYSAQMAKLRSEAAKMKESLRDAEVEAAAKGEEIRSLRATITGLQAAAGHTADVEAAGLRQRLAQLEAVVRARDKELDKLRSIKEVTVVQAEDGQANALDRAYEAETTARRLEAELVAARTRVGQLEQANAKRDRDVATMRDDLAAIKTCKVKELEAQLRAARQELDKRRADSEALRSAAYQEVYRLEDEVRVMGADLAAARNRAAQLEHVVRSKERDVARTKDEKEAAKAAERERARVAEDVSIKLEAELQAVKVRLAQAEGGLRTSEREAARLAELLRQTQGAEVEAWLKQAKSEEGSKKLESDFMSLRLRVLQLEAALKGRDKEVDKLGRGVEAIKAEAHELASKLAKSEEAARKAEGELSAARGKVLTLEGHVRVKEREQERLVRLVEGLKAGEAEVASRQGALEEAARRLEAALMAARGRVSGLEGVVRARDAAVERLNRQLEAAKTSDFERTAQVSKMEEVARQQEAESAAVRQRVVQLEGLLRTKERDLERSNRQGQSVRSGAEPLIQYRRQAEAARAAEGDMERRLADAGVAAAKLEVEVAAGRTRAAQLGEELRARERELAALTRSLEAQRSAEHSANVAVGKTEEAAKRLDSEASELRQRLVQAEGLLRVREREAERVARVLEAAQAAAADAAFKQSEAEAASRRLEAEAAGLRQRLAQTEGAVRSRERDVDRAEKLVEQAKCAEAEADTRRRAAEASVSAVDGEMSSLRSRIGQLEAAARGHTKEVERLMRVVDQSKTAEIAATARAQRSETAAKQVAAELVSARGRLSKLEASLAARGAESVRLQKLLVAAEAAASAQEARAEEFMRRVESDMAAMRQRALQLAGLLKGRDRQLTTLRGGSEAAQAEQEKCEDVIRKLEAELVSERQQVAQTAGQLRGRDKQITTLRNGLEALQGDQEKATAQLRKCEEALRKLDSDLSAERQRAAQLDGQVKARDKELERLTRQLDAGRDHSSSAAVVAGKEAAGLKEAAAKAEAALATARARITELESEMVSKERQLDGLQRLAGYSRAGDAEAAALAAERAGRAEEAAKRLDVELAGVRQKYSQLEHMYRSREAVIDKLKASLADKVAREERRLARDKAAYTRIRAAYLQTMAHSSTAGGAGGTPSGKAAGAMAAAARELRPVEIVGLYESRREALEEELSVCRAEVRSLAEQLRDAQNLITMKERSGAWRTPQELTDMQARVIMLERRCADLQREENRALKRELEILEKRVLQMKGSAAASGAGAVAEGGETALGLAVASKGRAGGPLMTTAQRMARDKSLHRLGLRGLEDWPKDVLVDLVQDVCIELDLSDATTLPAAVRKTLRVVDAAPRMEGFIAAVCEAVYKRGAAFVPPHIDGTTDPNRVLEVLAVWLGLLQEGSQLRGVMRSVSEALASRAEGMATPIHGPGDVLLSIRQLVEAEAVALTARESLAAASHHMAQQPEALLSRLVHHFMRLFDCPSLEGVVPCVNRLYVSLNELRNFARSLAATLGLPADAGASACMGRVRELLDAAAGRGEGGAGQQQRSSADGGGDRLLPDYIKGNHASAASPAASAGQPPAGAAAAAVGVEVSAALERLMAVFTVRTAGAAADAAERAVGRLRRLDEVLPRYQRLTSQLFEALRCTSLEEVMPAVRSLLAAAQQALY